MEAKICNVEGCLKEVRVKGLCGAHYFRQRRYGSNELPKTKREKLLEEGKSYCPKCDKIKFTKDFSADKYTAFGVSIYCKECKKVKSKSRYIRYRDRYRNYVLKKKFGITLQEYIDLFDKQGKKCAVCGKENKNKKPFPLDHCHKTGKVRGILCSQCNSGIGLFYDNVAFLKSAIEYLETSGA